MWGKDYPDIIKKIKIKNVDSLYVMSFTSIDERNNEDCLGSTTGFLCLHILSHIVAELAWLCINRT